MATKRAYTFSMVSYARRSEIEPLLQKSKHWAIISHENDVNTNGAHFHILVTFAQQKSFSQVCSYVESEQNTFAQEVQGTIADVLTYWTHKNSPEKTQHEKSEIQFDDERYWGRYDEEVQDDANEAFINDLIAQTSQHEMARRYGRDYMKNFAKYQQFGNILRNEQIRDVEKSLVGTCAYKSTFGENLDTYHAELRCDELQLINLISSYDVDIEDVISYVKHKAGIYE